MLNHVAEARSTDTSSVHVDSSGDEDASMSENMTVVATNVAHADSGSTPLSNLSNALSTLQEVDKLLQQHASFWSSMEVVIQILMQRANHVESLTNFTRNPRLHGRLVKRLDEYSATWKSVWTMCERFSVKSGNVTPYLYLFLQEEPEAKN